MTSRTGAWVLRGLSALTLAFIYLPLLVIVLFANSVAIVLRTRFEKKRG